MTPSTDFGSWLRVERLAREWRQADMAKALGVTANTVARWERGEVTPTPMAQAGIRAALAAQEKGKRGRG